MVTKKSESSIIKKLREDNKKLTKEDKSLKKKLREHSKHYINETRKALATAILAAFGFIMALSWRTVISGWVETIKGVGVVQSALIEAIIVTFISVLGIIIVTKFIKVDES